MSSLGQESSVGREAGALLLTEGMAITPCCGRHMKSGCESAVFGQAQRSQETGLCPASLRELHGIDTGPDCHSPFLLRLKGQGARLE